MDAKRLETYLSKILENLASKFPDTPLDPQLGKGTKFAQWAQHSSLHPFLPVWVSLERISRQCTYLDSLVGFAEQEKIKEGDEKEEEEERTDGLAKVRPSYNFVLRNGRASASSPNIQVLF